MATGITDTTAPTSNGRPCPITVLPEARHEVERTWTSVFFSPEGSVPRSVVISAAEPQEGVTQIAASLAIVGSSADYLQRVALVELNLGKPRLAEIFGIAGSPGVVDVLTGKCDLAAACTRFDGRLTVLPAGQTTGQANAVPNSAGLGDLLQSLLEQHDHVLIDAPAVNRYPVVQAVGRLTDGVLLVARAGVTNREAVAEARKRIELAQGKLLGLVLNMRTFPVPGFLYRRA